MPKWIVWRRNAEIEKESTLRKQFKITIFLSILGPRWSDSSWRPDQKGAVIVWQLTSDNVSTKRSSDRADYSGVLSQSATPRRRFCIGTYLPTLLGHRWMGSRKACEVEVYRMRKGNEKTWNLENGRTTTGKAKCVRHTFHPHCRGLLRAYGNEKQTKPNEKLPTLQIFRWCHPRLFRKDPLVDPSGCTQDLVMVRCVAHRTVAQMREIEELQMPGHGQG